MMIHKCFTNWHPMMMAVIQAATPGQLSLSIVNTESLSLICKDDLEEQLYNIEPNDIPKKVQPPHIRRAQSKVAHKTRRGMGNIMLPTNDGAFIAYIGDNLYDQPIFYEDGKYRVTDNFVDYFAFIKHDPIEILRNVVINQGINKIDTRGWQ